MSRLQRDAFPLGYLDVGAGEGNRTPSPSLATMDSTFELHLHPGFKSRNSGAGSEDRTRVCLVGSQEPYRLAMPANLWS